MDEGHLAKRSRTTNSVARFLERHECKPEGFVIVDYDRVWVTLNADGDHKITCNRETHESPELIKNAISLLDDKVTAEVYGVNILKLVAKPIPILNDILKHYHCHDVAELLRTYDREYIIIHFGKTHVKMTEDKCVLITKCGSIEWEEITRRAIDVIRYPGTVLRHVDHIIVINNYVDTKANIIAEAIEAEVVEKAIKDFLHRHNTTQVVFNYANHFRVSVKEDVVVSHHGEECHMPLLVDHTLSLFVFPDLAVINDTCTITSVPKNVEEACKAVGIVVKYANVANRDELIDALVDHDDFAVDNNNFTIRHKDDHARNVFEAEWAEQLNLARDVTEHTYNGKPNLDGKVNISMEEVPAEPFFNVYYRQVDATYYVWRVMKHGRETFLISGVPNMLLYSIELTVHEDNTLYITDFFSTNEDKSMFECSGKPFPHFISRGLFVIKHITLLCKAKCVILKTSLSAQFSQNDKDVLRDWNITLPPGCFQFDVGEDDADATLFPRMRAGQPTTLVATASTLGINMKASLSGAIEAAMGETIPHLDECFGDEYITFHIDMATTFSMDGEEVEKRELMKHPVLRPVSFSGVASYIRAEQDPSHGCAMLTLTHLAVKTLRQSDASSRKS